MQMAKTKGSTVTKFLCVVCKKDCTEKLESICCDACKLWAHAECTKLNNEQYKLLEESDREFKCHKCDPSFVISFGGSSSLTSKTGSSRSSNDSTMIKEVLSEIKELRKSVSYLSSQYDDIKQIVAQYNHEIAGLKKENRSLKSRLEQLEKTSFLFNKHGHVSTGWVLEPSGYQ